MANIEVAPAAVVFLIGFDVDQGAFCSFCRRHLFDFFDDADPFYTFLLAAADESGERDAVRTMFGEWPRLFVRAEDIRDTLADMASSAVAGVSDVSIVVIANRPSSLRSAELFEPLRRELADRKYGQTRFWLIAAFMNGPRYEEDLIGALLEGPAPLFQTVFLLGHEVGAPGFALNADHFGMLRLVVDVARGRSAMPDRGSPRQRLRPAQHGRQPRLLWVAEGYPEAENRSEDVLGYVKGALESLLKGEQYDRQRTTFSEFCKARIQDIQPDTNQQTGIDPFLGQRFNLGDGDGYQPSASNQIYGYDILVKTQEKQFYSNTLREVKNFIGDMDKDRVKSLGDVERQVDGVLLPDGGYSPRSRHAIDEEIAAIQRTFQGWEAEARPKRAEALAKHAELQGRADPAETGGLDFDSLPGADDFLKTVVRAQQAVRDLPYNRITLVALALSPPAMIALTLLYDAVAQPGGWGNLRNLMETWIVWAVFVSFICVAPPIVWLSSRRHHSLQKEAFAEARSRSDEIHASIVQAMDGTKDYVIRTRSALLGRALARLLKKRVADEPRSRLNDEATKFFHVHRALRLDEAEEVEVRRMVGLSPPDRWVPQLIAHRLRRKAARSYWELEIRGRESVAGVVVDQDATPEATILAGSSWLAGPAKATLVPLVWTRQPAIEAVSIKHAHDLDAHDPSTIPNGA